MKDYEQVPTQDSLITNEQQDMNMHRAIEHSDIGATSARRRAIAFPPSARRSAALWLIVFANWADARGRRDTDARFHANE